MPGFVVIGCGYVGERLARSLPGPVAVLARTAGRAEALCAAGLDAHLADLDVLDARAGLPVATAGRVLFYLAPPPGSGPGDPRLRRCLGALQGRPARIVYMSTTGVYGDAAGQDVNEESPLVPTSDRARARVDAEQAVRAFCEASRVEWVILRVPGIYGPGRLPLERIRRGEPMIREDQAGPGNRIHVDDLVRVCIAAGTSARAANRIYNVGDGQHASATQYFKAVARLAALPAPAEVSRDEARQQMSAMAWSFLGDSRRVDTSRMQRELDAQIRYHDLQEGIRASLQEEGSDPALSPPGGQSGV